MVYQSDPSVSCILAFLALLRIACSALANASGLIDSSGHALAIFFDPQLGSMPAALAALEADIAAIEEARREIEDEAGRRGRVVAQKLGDLRGHRRTFPGSGGPPVQAAAQG